MTFGFAPTFKVERTDLPNGHREYHVTCTLTHIATGAVVSEGVGCASTMESKHRWRGGGRLCPECGKATIIKGKADYGGGWLCFQKKGGCGSKWKEGDDAIEGQSTDRVENPDPADQYNTVLKMAKKRAQVDCTLTACGASDLLSQDLEDLPPGSPQPQPDMDAPPSASPPSEPPDLAARFDACANRREFVALDAEMRSDWERVPKSRRDAVTQAFKRADARTKAQGSGRAPAKDRPPIDVTPDEAAEIARQEARQKP
jgi:hypothetical protein